MAAINLDPGTSNDSMLRAMSINSLLSSRVYHCVVCVEVRNTTASRMQNPCVFTNSGQIVIPPKDIEPGQTEYMVATNRLPLVHGSWGTVSWTLSAGDTRRLVVMWCDPVNYDFYDNTLALAITPAGQAGQPDQRWTGDMYNGCVPTDWIYRINKYRDTVSQAVVEDDHIKVVGTMSTSHKANVVIEVFEKEESAGPLSDL